MGQLTMIGQIDTISYNPFKILYYGLFYHGGFILTFFVSILVFVCIIHFYMILFFKDENIDEERNFIISESGVYGTSHQMNEEEKRKVLDYVEIKDATGHILGLDPKTNLAVQINPNMPPKDELNKHIFISGGSGQRKTRSHIVPIVMQIIKRGESAIIADPKGECYKNTSRLAEKKGYKTLIFNLVDTLNSDGCDFLKMVGTSTIMAQSFAEILMANSAEENAKPKGDFWEKGEKALIAFGILYISTNDDIPKEEKKLHKVYEFLVYNTPDVIQDFAESLPKKHPARNQWSIFMTTPEATRAGIFTGLATRLQLLNEPTIQNITAHDEIDLIAATKEKTLIYIDMSDQEATLNYIAAIFLSFAFILQVRTADKSYTGKTKIPFWYIFEEFPNIGKIPYFVQKMNTIRGRGINCVILTQGLGRMMDKYPGHEWEDIIAACDTQIFLGINEHETNASWWSDKTGTMTVEVESEREDKYLLDPFRMNTSMAETKGKGKRNVFTTDEITTMSKDYELVFLTGYHVLKLKKFDYSMHEYSKEIEPQLAYMHQPKWWNEVKREKWFQQEYAKMQKEWDEIEKERIEEERKKKKKNQKKQKEKRTQEDEKARQPENGMQSLAEVFSNVKESVKEKGFPNVQPDKFKLPTKNDILKKSIKTLSQYVTEDIVEEPREESSDTQIRQGKTTAAGNEWKNEEISNNPSAIKTDTDPVHKQGAEPFQENTPLEQTDKETLPKEEPIESSDSNMPPVTEEECQEYVDELEDFWNQAEMQMNERVSQRESFFYDMPDEEDERETDIEPDDDFIDEYEKEESQFANMKKQKNMKGI